MREILPGIHHWTAFRDTIGTRVSSYWVAPAGILIDPMIPEEGLEAVTALDPRPQQILLTNRHHLRHGEQLADALDCPIRYSPPSQDELGHLRRGRRYEWGHEVAPGVTALEIDILAPDEAGLLIAHGEGALAIGDTLTCFAGVLGFFGDDLLGHDPKRVKEGLRNRFRALLARDFDALLPAHGVPLASHAKTTLRDFVTLPVGEPDFGSTL
jgi:hypothetical protein